MEKWDVIVVGGGAAGLLAASKAGELGAKVKLLEKNSFLGKKLLITGKGRCNLTNAGEIEDLISAFGAKGNFLYSAFYKFSNMDTIKLFNELGVATQIERGKRVFPMSGQSKDVVKALVANLHKNNVSIQLDTPVKEIMAEKMTATGLILNTGQLLKSKAVILACGGVSYPLTGSSGDGYLMAEKLGHTIVSIKPALVPLVVQEDWVKYLQGLTLKNVELAIIVNKKKKKVHFGEMIFTHFGVSGPIVLSLSKEVNELLELTGRPVSMSLDLKPALTGEKLDLRLQRDFIKYSNKQLKNSLGDLLPKALIPIILKYAAIHEEKNIHQITREERVRLVEILKNLPLTVVKTRPVAEAIVTAGGVDLKEIDPGSMESKLIKGLYMAGEMLDLDGVTGGFNLQAAFSTGYLAGLNAAFRQPNI